MRRQQLEELAIRGVSQNRPRPAAAPTRRPSGTTRQRPVMPAATVPLYAPEPAAQSLPVTSQLYDSDPPRARNASGLTYQPPAHLPQRPSRFTLTNPRQTTSVGSMRQMLEESQSARIARQADAARTRAEMAAFMRALAEVERLGPRLHTLPRNRLLQIQSILCAGVRAPGEDTYLLPPVQGMERSWPTASEAGPGRELGGESGGDAVVAVLTREQLDSLPGHVATRADAARGETCAICLCEPEVGDVLCTLACTHVFHKACVTQWLQRSVACPLCKGHALGEVR